MYKAQKTKSIILTDDLDEEYGFHTSIDLDSLIPIISKPIKRRKFIDIQILAEETKHIPFFKNYINNDQGGRILSLYLDIHLKSCYKLEYK